ncbi:ElaB/YqjD/DUF883 family membrane-anchored ribosome-binding protein [Inquilinus ginsengisoli]|uniref:ElaB/YqjD/DUF883 family membrane-anchored ribosome-binding protein n=1 Tax=Inquilinus ginsengisoli TaxID=363840 RepID=A0ABU1JYN2_9PROT|nr:hypothetical protein [Inquilinus ginsengisoli]MDR6292665.1 ElaB/YqjD/DUF883 family membrane-anchored ribosome-binding protein [Inquilinus ginsengisoli]
MATRNLDQELDTLRADLGKIRDDIASLARTLGDAATAEAKAGGARINEAAHAAKDRAQRFAESARTQGEDSIAALEERIEQNPITSILVAFGVGLVIGKLLDR